MAYDPKRSRPSVGVRADDAAAVDDLVPVTLDGDQPNQDPAAEDVGALAAIDRAESVAAPVEGEGPPTPDAPSVAARSPSVGSAEPPDRRVAKAVAAGIVAATVLALMVAWRRGRS